MDPEETEDPAPQPETAPPVALEITTDLQSQASETGRWTTDIFDCDDDEDSCLLVPFLPCIAFGQIAEILDRGSPSCETSAISYIFIAILCPLFAFKYAVFYRSKLRAQYSLPAAPFPDYLVHLFCHWCALCQEYRELQNRGFDLDEGWEGNTNKKGQGVTEPPAVQQGMTR